MKVKDTLHLGQTKFDMRANLPQKEVALQEEWKKESIYQKIQQKNEENLPLFFMMVLHIRMASYIWGMRSIKFLKILLYAIIR